MMPASLSPLALIIPRPNIPSTVPPTSAPRTPNRSPAAPHVLLSPPPANRNSTDSWNSSNYDFSDPNVVWKDDQVRLLSRTLDALPAHLITPFNGSVPPSNLLDKVSRGILAAKGPNDWPHSIRATRIKLLELARRKAQEERRRVAVGERSVPLDLLARPCRARTPDPAEVLQLRTNTPVHTRRPLYRQSSMDFMGPDKPDRSESIARLSTRLQRHDRMLHHPYFRPVHTHHRFEHNRSSPSTPSSSTLYSNRHSGVRNSTISATSASSSSCGSPMSISAPLGLSSLRRTSTLTLGSASEVHVGADSDTGNASKDVNLRCSDGYPDAGTGVEQAPSYSGCVGVVSLAHATPASKQKMLKSTPITTVASQQRTIPNSLAGEAKPLPRTPPNEPRILVSERPTPIQTGARVKKVRKGHKPQLSFSSDEEEKVRSRTAKKVRTCEPSWSIPLASVARTQTSLLLSSVLLREKGGHDLGRSTGIRSKPSMSSSSSTDNDLSTASTETAATSVSIPSTSPAKHKSPRNPVLVQPLVRSPGEVKKTARRNPTRNPSMFGHELPHPQRTPTSPSRIPVSSPIPLSPPVSSVATPSNASSTSPLSVSSRPRTLRRAARRISFGSAASSGILLSPVENPWRHDGEMPALGSAFQLA